MPLEASKPTLESDFSAAYKKVKTDGTVDGADPNAIIAGLANELATAINVYMLSALVNTDIEVQAGQADSTGGTTTGPGSGAGAGNLS